MRVRSSSVRLFSTSVLTLALIGTAPARAAQVGGQVGARVDWSKPGPDQVTEELLPAHTLYAPKPLRGRHPVIVWGNGTFAFPAIYGGLLRHWASHGFIVVAANTPMSGSGKEMRAGIDLLAKRDADAGSPFHGKVDLSHIAATGHSQGGAGSVNTAADRRVTTVLPIQPGGAADVRALRVPTFYVSGQKDGLVAPAEVKALYNASGHVPALYGELRGAGHLVPLGDGGGYRGPATAWMYAMLRNDGRARAEFFGPGCGYCGTSAFSEFRRNGLAERY
ncbi:alpha/beta hydrolase family protein [Actinomadura hibisca]|uniref:alpha/beta hydrolase family protein n=1 Tax=Actinomadura hibisca TaxID=68565 RepID=UPI000835124A|nr:alpha/beta hydrolase [Actinomadura hibisca]